MDLFNFVKLGNIDKGARRKDSQVRQSKERNPAPVRHVGEIESEKKAGDQGGSMEREQFLK